MKSVWSCCLHFYLFNLQSNSAAITIFFSAPVQKVFGDEYYGEEEGEKPQFDDDDELEGEPVLPDEAVFSPDVCTDELKE